MLSWCLGNIPRADVFGQRLIWTKIETVAKNAYGERNSQLICFTLVNHGYA